MKALGFQDGSAGIWDIEKGLKVRSITNQSSLIDYNINRKPIWNISAPEDCLSWLALTQNRGIFFHDARLKKSCIFS